MLPPELEIRQVMIRNGFRASDSCVDDVRCLCRDLLECQTTLKRRERQLQELNDRNNDLELEVSRLLERSRLRTITPEQKLTEVLAAQNRGESVSVSDAVFADMHDRTVTGEQKLTVVLSEHALAEAMDRARSLSETAEPASADNSPGKVYKFKGPAPSLLSRLFWWLLP